MHDQDNFDHLVPFYVQKPQWDAIHRIYSVIYFLKDLEDDNIPLVAIWPIIEYLSRDADILAGSAKQSDTFEEVV